MTPAALPARLRYDVPGMARSGSLFTGVLGLDMAAAEVFGTELAWLCDNDPAASAVLAHRFPRVPNLGDITTVDWATVPPVEVMTGGFPCQDLSAAGRRAGLTAGTRSGLWSHMATAIHQLRPRLVVIENVRGLCSACADSTMGRCPRCVGGAGPHRPVLRGLGRVLGDLANLGYDAVWHGLPAAAVGAPHERFRIFILATDRTHGHAAADADRQRHGQARRPATGQAQGTWPFHPAGQRGDVPAISGQPAAADTARDGWQQGRPEPARQLRGPDAALRGGAAVADPDDIGPARTGLVWHGWAEGHQSAAGPDLPAWGIAADPGSGGRGAGQPDLPAGQPDPVGSGVDPDVDWGVYADAVRRWEHVLGRPAPRPQVTGPRGGLKLNPELCEWMQGFPAGWITDVPGVSVNDALRLAGNSVNPRQAVAALRRLLAQLDERAA